FTRSIGNFGVCHLRHITSVVTWARIGSHYPIASLDYATALWLRVWIVFELSAASATSGFSTARTSPKRFNLMVNEVVQVIIVVGIFFVRFRSSWPCCNCRIIYERSSNRSTGRRRVRDAPARRTIVERYRIYLELILLADTRDCTLFKVGKDLKHPP